MIAAIVQFERALIGDGIRSGSYALEPSAKRWVGLERESPGKVSSPPGRKC